MKSKILIALALPSLLFAYVASAAEGMTVQTWDPEMGCEHTMTTNHFELAPRDSVEIDLNLTGCTPDNLGGLLYFGYNTTKNRSRPLTSRNRIRLTLVDGDGNETVSDSGSIYIEVDQPETCKLYAENMNRNKTLKIRLRSSSGL